MKTSSPRRSAEELDQGEEPQPSRDGARAVEGPASVNRRGISSLSELLHTPYRTVLLRLLRPGISRAQFQAGAAGTLYFERRRILFGGCSAHHRLRPVVPRPGN